MILALDTSSKKISLALFWPKKLEKEISWLTKETSSELLPKIEWFLRKNGVKLKDLKAIAVFQGPGSFTGLRVGISVANTLGYSLKIPVFGFAGSQYQDNPLFMAKEVFERLKRKKVQVGNFAKPIYPPLK